VVRNLTQRETVRTSPPQRNMETSKRCKSRRCRSCSALNDGSECGNGNVRSCAPNGNDAIGYGIRRLTYDAVTNDAATHDAATTNDVTAYDATTHDAPIANDVAAYDAATTDDATVAYDAAATNDAAVANDAAANAAATVSTTTIPSAAVPTAAPVSLTAVSRLRLSLK